MSDQLSEQDLKRLNDLAALRDRGVLSEEEFARAKQRLLEGRRSPALRREDDADVIGAPPRRVYRPWLFLTLATLALVAVLVWLVITRRDGIAERHPADDKAVFLNESVPPLPGPELCTSEAIYRQIKDIIFDRTIERYDGDPGALNSLRRAAGVRMQYPVLREYQAEIERADCSGRLILDIPPAAQDEFDAAPSLQANLDYSIQPAIDGGSAVVELEGIEVTVQRIVVAATMLAETRSAAEEARRLQEGIHCNGSQSSLEIMICEDEDLVERSRVLAERYRGLRELLPPAESEQLAQTQRQFIQRLSNCRDPACVAALYRDRSAELDRLAVDADGIAVPFNSP